MEVFPSCGRIFPVFLEKITLVFHECLWILHWLVVLGSCSSQFFNQMARSTDSILKKVIQDLSPLSCDYGLLLMCWEKKRYIFFSPFILILENNKFVPKTKKGLLRWH